MIPCAYDGRVRRVPTSAKKTAQSPSASKTTSSNHCLYRRKRFITCSRTECRDTLLYARRFFLTLVFLIHGSIAFLVFFNIVFCSILTHNTKHSRTPNRTLKRTLIQLFIDDPVFNPGFLTSIMKLFGADYHSAVFTVPRFQVAGNIHRICQRRVPNSRRDAGIAVARLKPAPADPFFLFPARFPAFHPRVFPVPALVKPCVWSLSNLSPLLWHVNILATLYTPRPVPKNLHN